MLPPGSGAGRWEVIPGKEGSRGWEKPQGGKKPCHERLPKGEEVQGVSYIRFFREALTALSVKLLILDGLHGKAVP